MCATMGEDHWRGRQFLENLRGALTVDGDTVWDSTRRCTVDLL